MGAGISYVQYRKKIIKTQSSTETDLFGVDDVLTQVIWNQYFLKYQGYKIRDNVIYQDIQSTIKLDKNGICSSIKRTRHINIRYYFITDRINKEETYVQFCPTLETIRYYFTKAMQVSQFHSFHYIILVIHEDEIPSYNASGRAYIEEQKIKLQK